MDQYIPPLWIMCLESVAHLLVMFNFSSNFLIYCSVSNQFKATLSKLCHIFCKKSSKKEDSVKYQNIPTVITPKDQRVNLHLIDLEGKFDIESNEENLFQSTHDGTKTDVMVLRESDVCP